MIQLFPPSDDNVPVGDAVDVAVLDAVGAENRVPIEGRPWLFTNMIVSADGATAVGGLSGELGADGDRAMFRALRAQADVILVGAGTARQEMYQPPIAYEAAQQQRRRRDQSPRPRLALVSRRLDLDPSLPLFADDDTKTRPFVITTAEALAADTSGLDQRAEVLVAGVHDVELSVGIDLLAEHGARTVLCEGGPSLNGRLAATDLIDEWNLTVAPLLVGGDSKRAAVGPLPGGPPSTMHLARVWTLDHYLFCRWTRSERGQSKR